MPITICPFWIISVKFFPFVWLDVSDTDICLRKIAFDIKPLEWETYNTYIWILIVEKQPFVTQGIEFNI